MGYRPFDSLLLDLNLCVQRFTPAVTRIINLCQADIGCPVKFTTFERPLNR